MDPTDKMQFETDAEILAGAWERMSADCRYSTNESYPVLVKAFKEGFWLLNSSIDRSQPTFNKRKGEEFKDVVEEWASFYVSMLASSSIRNTWIAMKLIETGAYSAALGMCRNLLEVYKRSMYLRVLPSEVFRFYSIEDIPIEIQELEGSFRQSRRPDSNEYESAITENAHRFGDLDIEWVRAQWSVAKDLTKDLHPYSHASIESTMDMVVVDPQSEIQTLVMIEPALAPIAIELAGKALLRILFIHNYEALRRKQLDAVWLGRWNIWNQVWAVAWQDAGLMKGPLAAE